MVTKDEALKEAYEILKDIAENATSHEDGWCGAEAEKVLPVIEKALAQPAQEPLLALFDENQRLRAELKFNTVQQQEPRNFCPRCGKRRGGDVNYIHTCTPPRGLEMT